MSAAVCAPGTRLHSAAPYNVLELQNSASGRSTFSWLPLVLHLCEPALPGKETPFGFFLKNVIEGTSLWHSDQESACQCRGHRFEPRSGKIPRAVEQLNPRATTTEPVL